MEVNKSSYQELIEKQIIERSTYGDPFEMGIMFLAEEWGEIPIWGLSFNEKPVIPPEADSFQLIINDEKVLQDMNAPRRYARIKIEREIVQSPTNRDALVERVYFIREDNEHEMQYTAVVYRGDHTFLGQGEAELFVSFANDKGGPGIYRLECENIRGCLQRPIPLILK